MFCVTVNASVHFWKRAFAVKGLRLNFTSLMQNTHCDMRVDLHTVNPNQNNNSELLFSLRMGCFDAPIKEIKSAWRWGILNELTVIMYTFLNPCRNKTQALGFSGQHGALLTIRDWLCFDFILLKANETNNCLLRYYAHYLNTDTQWLATLQTPFILIAIWLVRNAMNICLAVVIACNQFYNYVFNDIWNQCAFLLSRCVFVYFEDSVCKITISITWKSE